MKVEPRKVQLNDLTGEPVTDKQRKAIEFIHKFTSFRFAGQYKHEATAFIGKHLDEAVAEQCWEEYEDLLNDFLRDEIDTVRRDRNGRIW